MTGVQTCALPISAGRFGGKPFGKPGFGPAKSFGKKPFAPRQGEGFAPRDRAPFDRNAGERNFGDRNLGDRDGNRFEQPRPPMGGDVQRSPFDRAPSAGRVDHKAGGFAPRKPGAPAGKGPFKPQRPRPGGFSR